MLGTLLHEMVHLRNFAVGLNDCSRSQYHNRHFRDAAILAGPDCLCWTRSRGYGHTQLGDRSRTGVETFQPLKKDAFQSWPPPVDAG